MKFSTDSNLSRKYLPTTTYAPGTSQTLTPAISSNNTPNSQEDTQRCCSYSPRSAALLAFLSAFFSFFSAFFLASFSTFLGVVPTTQIAALVRGGRFLKSVFFFSFGTSPRAAAASFFCSCFLACFSSFLGVVPAIQMAVLVRDETSERSVGSTFFFLSPRLLLRELLLEDILAVVRWVWDLLEDVGGIEWVG